MKFFAFNIGAVFSLPPFTCRNEAVSCEHSINYSNKSRIVQMGNGGAGGQLQFMAAKLEHPPSSPGFALVY